MAFLPAWKCKASITLFSNKENAIFGIVDPPRDVRLRLFLSQVDHICCFSTGNEMIKWYEQLMRLRTHKDKGTIYFLFSKDKLTQ